jgi:hypothetical protein
MLCWEQRHGQKEAIPWAIHCRRNLNRERVVTYQATYTLAGPPELRWGNLKGVRVWRHATCGKWDGMVPRRDTGMETCLFSPSLGIWMPPSGGELT